MTRFRAARLMAEDSPKGSAGPKLALAIWQKRGARMRGSDRNAALDAFRADNLDASPSDALPRSAERSEAEGRGQPEGLRRPETRACRQAKARGGNAE